MSDLILGNSYNNNHVNAYNSQYSGNFGSNELPVNGSFRFKGGSKNKNITKHYKRMGSRIKSMKRRRSRSISLAGGKRGTKRRIYGLSRSMSLAGGKRRRIRRQRGGNHAQHYNNYPNTPGYSVAGIHLSSSNSALANPVPYVRLNNNVNGVDNYSRYTNSGFSSIGH